MQQAFLSGTPLLTRLTVRSSNSVNRSGLKPQLSFKIAAMSHIAQNARPLYDLYVKESPEKGELGDCPFSHRTMLTLEEKGIPYNKLLVDELKIPDWVAEVSEGQKKIPFALELDTGKWLHDSDKMIPYLEDKFSDRKKLGKPGEVPEVASGLFPSFMEFVKSKRGSEEEEKKGALLSQMREINDFLEEKGTPYIGGSDVCATDLKLGPQLKHIVVGGKQIKGFEIPPELKAVQQYLERLSERPSWKATYYTEQYVQDGWEKKLETMGVDRAAVHA